jgi:serine/threonine protein kinase
MSNPKKVGEGSYGCVHNPPLKCRDNLYNPDPTKVSKILTKKNANSELKEFKLIQAADKKEDFHLGKPGSCFPDNTEVNAKAIDQCRDFSSFEIDNYKLLLLKNGGQDLSNIDDKLTKLKVNSTNRRRLENFWLDMSRLIYGSNVLIDKGLVHHDLKQQNIVYNEDTGRVNFIDFGLMTTTKEMLKKANGSRYPFGSHWSFPPDILYFNYVAYKRMTALTGRKKLEYIQNEFKKYNTPFEIIKTYLIDKNEDNIDFLKRTTWSYFELCMRLKNDDDSYKEFINKSFETFDNYSIGFSLFSILQNTKELIDEKLYNDLRLLFLSMMSFNVFERPSPSEVVDKYEFILKSNRLLEKYSMRFENHFLVEGTEKQEVEKKMEELPKNDKEFIEELILICPPGKERNPKTKRCVNKCKDGYTRDKEFKCKKNKTQKNKSQKNKSQKNKKEIIDLVSTKTASMVDLHKSPEKVSFKSKTQKNKKCPEGKELNTKTNRCNKIKKTQKNKKCPEGKELNPKTNRCNKIKKTQKNKK